MAVICAVSAHLIRAVNKNPLRRAPNAFGATAPSVSQPDGMSCFKTARRPINSLPARRPFADVTIVWGRVEPQPGNDGEGVTLARVDGDPFAGPAVPVVAKLG